MAMSELQMQQRVTILENQLVKMKDHELLLMNRIKQLEHCINEKLEDHPKYASVINKIEELQKREVAVLDKELELNEKVRLLKDFVTVAFDEIIDEHLMLSDNFKTKIVEALSK